LKYNNEKLLLEKKEIGEKNGIIESPHEHTRDKILQVYELDIKYKAIQLFIERYCKKGSDPYWYYCIDTGVKIMPAFFNKLATAYLITNNYENVLEDPNNVVCHKIRGVVDSSYILHITTAYGCLLDRAKEYEAYHKGIETLKNAYSNKPAPKTTKRASTRRK
jgi:hypothetical protein